MSRQNLPAVSGTAIALRLLVLTAALAIYGPAVRAEASLPADHQPVVRELDALLQKRPPLRDLLAGAIHSADVQGIGDFETFYAYLDEVVTWIPVERDFVNRLLKLYYIVNQAPGDGLNRDAEFSTWLKHFVQAYGAFLDTPESTAGIETFTANPDYRVDDYHPGPSGWQTFNQFFARQVRPGMRPIAGRGDPRVIVSPADAVFMGAWPIDADSRITVKGVQWAIADLLAGSPYAGAFAGGVYTHSFLYVDDYHRYHVPVAGTIMEIRNVSGRVYMDVVRRSDGTLDVVDGDTYQFNQERGLVVIESPEVGLVAVLPIGMSYVSSVNLTPREGAELRKGDEFGYFLFGGSDIVMLFQDKGVVFDAEVGTKYLQGHRIGHVE